MCQICFSFETTTLIGPEFVMRSILMVAVRTWCALEKSFAYGNLACNMAPYIVKILCKFATSSCSICASSPSRSRPWWTAVIIGFLSHQNSAVELYEEFTQSFVCSTFGLIISCVCWLLNNKYKNYQVAWAHKLLRINQSGAAVFFRD